MADPIKVARPPVIDDSGLSTARVTTHVEPGRRIIPDPGKVTEKPKGTVPPSRTKAKAKANATQRAKVKPVKQVKVKTKRVEAKAVARKQPPKPRTGSTGGGQTRKVK